MAGFETETFTSEVSRLEVLEIEGRWSLRGRCRETETKSAGALTESTENLVSLTRPKQSSSVEVTSHVKCRSNWNNGNNGNNLHQQIQLLLYTIELF